MAQVGHRPAASRLRLEKAASNDGLLHIDTVCFSCCRIVCIRNYGTDVGEGRFMEKKLCDEERFLFQEKQSPVSIESGGDFQKKTFAEKFTS